MIPAGILGSARVAPASGPALTYQGQSGSTSDLTTYSLAGVPIGAADAARVVIIAVMARYGPGGTPTLNSATIGGVAATIDVQHGDTVGDVTAIIRAVVPTGTTATVGLTFSQTMSRVAIGVYTYTGGITLAATGGEANNTNDTGMSATLTGSLAGDLIVAGCSTGTATNTVTWSGATEDFEALYEIVFSSAHGVAAGSNAVVSATLTDSTQFKALAAAAYRGV